MSHTKVCVLRPDWLVLQLANENQVLTALLQGRWRKELSWIGTLFLGLATVTVCTTSYRQPLCSPYLTKAVYISYMQSGYGL